MKEGAVIILRREEDDAVLMQLRDDIPTIPYPDYWALISGATEEGETPLQTALRELEEETEYVANDLEYLFDSLQLINGREILRSVFGGVYDGVQEIKCHEGREIRFVHPSEFPNLKVFSEHVQFVQSAAQLRLAR